MCLYLGLKVQIKFRLPEIGCWDRIPFRFGTAGPKDGFTEINFNFGKINFNFGKINFNFDGINFNFGENGLQKCKK